jgi:hypothetical protein
MAFTEFKFAKKASDLLIGHLTLNFSNDNANITPPAAGAALAFGTVVARDKGLGVASPWAAVVAGDLTTDNEFAVVWGNHYAFASDFVPRAIVSGKYNALVIKRDAQFKEFYIKQAQSALSATNFDILKQLMADQGLLVLDDVTKLKAA